MTEEQYPIWQHLMNEAYAQWKDTLTYERWLEIIGPVRRKAVLLGNLNYQVHNGGFNQWVDNAYGLHAMDVLEILGEIDTNNSLEVSEMIEQICPYINFESVPEGFGANYWRTDENNDWCMGNTIADSIDEQYYSINDDLMEDIEVFLKSLLKGEE